MTQTTSNFSELIKAEGKFIAESQTNGATSERRAVLRAESGDDCTRHIRYAKTVGAGRDDRHEPWVSFSEEDRVGLALSGGGIRSATFNLGLLQGLNDLDLLPQFDYLATVSGGGYIGSWWTAWRFRNRAEHFPVTIKGTAVVSAASAEADAVRHLRRFSNYLVPRFGFLEVEFWNGVVAVLSGLVPALTVAISVMALAIWLWLVVGWFMLAQGVIVSTFALGMVAALVFLGAEIWWRLANPKPTGAIESAGSVAAYVILCLAATAGIIGLRLLVNAYDVWLPALPDADSPAAFYSPLPLGDAPHLLALLLPGLIFAVVGVALVFLRFLGIIGASGPDRTHVGDKVLRRVMGRLAFLALIWTVPALIWWAASYLHESANLIVATSGLGGLSAALFAWLRTWIVRALQPGRQPGFAKKLRALLPQVLAYVALVSALALVCILTQSLLSRPASAAASYLVPVIVVVCAFLWFDPVNCGLHAFYRDRLSRAYLGASLTEQQLPREINEELTDPHPLDDITLSEIKAGHNQAPLHLVCCAANELDADPMSNFSRGARSAVLSPLGLVIGDRWRRDAGLSLGSAITASAAAFNSNMGSVSKQLGSAVTFLMCALNLRLGLWTARPGHHPKLSWLKGWVYFYEMFGRTSKSQIHLSDGGHFDNLALYELVRRHCRYVVLSDVGADPDVAFDDLGNAVRRIREDFGVDIEIDTEPLRPGPNGLARQHMVVGTIHYDHSTGDGRLDKGVLLYFKPSLTGDEPIDVRQYRSRNADFPNESTVDQFYDEAQWEAYRRLGRHAARAALGFVETLRQSGTPSPSDVFVGARWKWYPTPPELPENMRALTARFVAFEEQLRVSAPPRLVKEIYPELTGKLPEGTWTHKERAAVVHVLIQMVQLMEDAYIACQLESHWNHPLNSGWMNWFRRWSCTPTFRSWWPVLKGMYCDAFRCFVEQRLNVPGAADLELSQRFGHWCDVPQGLAREFGQHTRLAERNTAYWAGSFAFDDSSGPLSLQVCLLSVTERGDTWYWQFDDLFVLPALGCTGTASQFLATLICRFEQPDLPANLRYLKVVNRLPAGAEMTAVPNRIDSVASAAQRAELGDYVAQYKQLGFVEQQDGSLLYTLHKPWPD